MKVRSDFVFIALALISAVFFRHETDQDWAALLVALSFSLYLAAYDSKLLLDQGITAFITLSTAAIPLFLYFLNPSLFLWLILLESALYFGLSDRKTDGLSGILEACARGVWPISALCFFHPDQMTLFFSHFTENSALFVDTLSFLAPLAVFLFVIVCLLNRKKTALILEIFSLSALFILCPPLLSFTIYFAILHTFRLLERNNVPFYFLGWFAAACLSFPLAYLTFNEEFQKPVVLYPYILLFALLTPHAILQSPKKKWRTLFSFFDKE